MIQYAQDDFGFYSIDFLDGLGVLTPPDWNATLYFEFRDSAGVLQFTATTSSTPPLDTVVPGKVFAANIPLTAFALGVVQVRVYAQMAGVNIMPHPLVATAFEVIATAGMTDLLRDLLKIDGHAEDAMLATLILSAAGYAEKYLARSLLAQTRVKQFEAPMGRGLSASMLKWPTLVLTYPPVGVITRVYAKDADGDETDIDAADYWLDGVSDPPELQLMDWAWEGKLRVIYTCGYGTYADLPEAIRRGILLHAAYLYKYRGDCDVNESAERSGAIGAYRIYRVMRRG
jgi:uncharacterized phiE125 gp8 family phage protein